MIKNKDVEIFEYYGNRVTINIKQKDDKLDFFIHDKGGWVFDTKNIVVALYVLKDKAIKDLMTNSNDDTKIIDILNAKVRYDKELIINSLEEDGDLMWVSWLTKDIFNYGDDKEFIYSMVQDDFYEQGYSDEDDKDSDTIDCAYWDIIDKYDGDKILEKIKEDYESELKYIINESSDYVELTKKIHELSNEISSSSYDYLLDFIAENKAY